MKKEFMKPEAEKLTFDFSQNVTASYAKTDAPAVSWVCNTRPVYNDSLEKCAPRTETSTLYWACE